MFTGIVTAVGRITSARPKGDGMRLRIDAPGLGMDDVSIGDSIALQGVCHTVVAKDTLFNLSKRYGVKVEELAAANGMAVSSPLKLGTVLKIPAPTSAGR